MIHYGGAKEGSCGSSCRHRYEALVRSAAQYHFRFPRRYCSLSEPARDRQAAITITAAEYQVMVAKSLKSNE